MTNLELEKTANEVRKSIVTAVHSAKAGHPGGSLSAADIFTYLYFEELHIDPIDMSSGSLGQGLSAAAGMAAAGKFDKKDYRVYALCGDGEIQEGQIWEAAMWAGFRKLDNLVVIVDNNNLQIDGTVETKGMPTAIIAKTVKGKGVSFMENAVDWHGKAPNDAEYEIAMKDLEKVGEALCQK